ncbi:hypothetical protein HY025_03860 [Candidatus Daviesbacteria bacterium]|nr:hypothetical protein [Candidatus Daviesbacteria bacterium]
MKIAVVRASSLNKWEMQNYEPLVKRNSIIAIGSTNPVYLTANIKLTIKKLICLGDLLAYFPYGIRRK